jgi:uncharacterized protein (TIRG00374 family)
VRTNWRWLAAGLLIGGFAAWFTFSHTDVRGVVTVLSGGVDWRLLALALLSYGFFFVLKALRWKLLLRPLASLPLGWLTAYVLLGYAGNVLLPLQAGDLARGYLLARRHDLSPAAVIPGIAVEKLFDFLALLLLLIWAAWDLEVRSELVDEVVFGVALASSTAGLLLALVVLRPRTALALTDRLLALGPSGLAGRLRPLAVQALTGLAALGQGRTLVQVLVVSLMAWVVMLAALWLVIAALGIEAPPALSVIVLLLSAVGLALPTSPGFVGTLQAAFVLGMVPFGIGQEAAVAASLVYQGMTTVPPLLIGALCWVTLRPSHQRDGSTVDSGPAAP